jgi:hypothetical protein
VKINSSLNLKVTPEAGTFYDKSLFIFNLSRVTLGTYPASLGIAVFYKTLCYNSILIGMIHKPLRADK